ncbi:MAG: PEP-CTERM sorting domain-containing protein [Chloroflexi bacterium]|nr:PEP-CTERM sorting domain-containing protein [Chloroflexota bacterium]
MRTKRLLRVLFVLLGLLFSVVTVAGADPWLTEGFESLPEGWLVINRSEPAGTTSWRLGSADTFAAQAGSAGSYMLSSFTVAAPEGGTISNWLISPEIPLNDILVIGFYTRQALTTYYADRLQVRLSVSGASTDVGTTAESVGVFTHLLLDINEQMAAGGYPTEWRRYGAFDRLFPPEATGRIAFRHYLPDANGETNRGLLVAIDSVSLETHTEILFLPLVINGQ